MKFNQELIEKLKNKEVVIENNGKLSQLRDVLNYAFPLDKSGLSGSRPLYGAASPNYWTTRSLGGIPSLSVSDFILSEDKQEECICNAYMGSDLLIEDHCPAKVHGKKEPEFKWGEDIQVLNNESWQDAIYIGLFPAAGIEPVYAVNRNGSVEIYKNIRKIPMTIAVTMQEIAEWKGCSVEQIKIVD